MRALVGAALLALAVAGCAQTIETTSTFDPNEVSYFNRAGRASITGQALMRQMGGGVVTCAATEVDLFPAGTYAKERMSKAYGDVNGGSRGALAGLDRKNVPPAYYAMQKKTICDAQGNFEFQGLADGDYYIVAHVIWSSGNSLAEGALLAKLVKIRNGQSQRVVLTN